jgi:septal ring-binding cell division protein DamX
MIATLVEWDLLAEAIYVSIIVGIAVSVIAAIAVRASLKAQDERAAGQEGAAALNIGLTGLCVLALAAAIVVGIYLLTQ